jgi:hypothetical protein
MLGRLPIGRVRRRMEHSVIASMIPKAITGCFTPQAKKSHVLLKLLLVSDLISASWQN